MALDRKSSYKNMSKICTAQNQVERSSWILFVTLCLYILTKIETALHYSTGIIHCNQVCMKNKGIISLLKTSIQLIIQGCYFSEIAELPLLSMRCVLSLALSIATPWISTHTCGSTMELAFSVLIFGSCCADIIWQGKCNQSFSETNINDWKWIKITLKSNLFVYL